MVCLDRNYLSQNSDVRTRHNGTPGPNISPVVGALTVNLGVSRFINTNNNTIIINFKNSDNNNLIK